MLLYFSGTGNSEYVAETLSNFLNEELLFIPDIDPENWDYLLTDRIVFVFPVYSWGVPPLIKKFVIAAGHKFWDKVNDNGVDVHCVMTCGDEVAKAPEMMRDIMKKVGVKIRSVHSVIMPNNYVLLPGFDVDKPDVEKQKLENCQRRILQIAESINRNEKIEDVVRGSMPGLKTHLVFPLFKKWGIFPSKWHYLPSCISCGKCEKVCPLCNVKMNNGHPQWGNRCCSCLACYHICPSHAVAYGKETLKKGQYFFPLKKISSRRCRR